MAIYFVDSSALLKRYRYEEGSERVSDLLDGADRLLMSRLGQVEVSAAIIRRGRNTGRSEQDLAAVLKRFDQETLNSFDVVELDILVIEGAIAMARKHGLRAADAIQLASALLARDVVSSRELTLLASDQELNAAASSEGLLILDPAKN